MPATVVAFLAAACPPSKLYGRKTPAACHPRRPADNWDVATAATMPDRCTASRSRGATVLGRLPMATTRLDVAKPPGQLARTDRMNAAQ